MIVDVPVYLSDSLISVKAEIQIRTIAMDFWASLEHKINYKFSKNVPEHIKKELVESSKIINKLDDRMNYFNKIVNS